MPHKQEDDPVTDDEFLLRRVFVDRFNDDRMPIISLSAFEPRSRGDNQDVNGISLYRRSCLDSPYQVLELIPCPAKRQKTGIVQVQVRSLVAMNLTVLPDRIDEIPGHVLIPELNSTKYSNDKSSLKPTLLKLATIASEPENILVRPSSSGAVSN